MRNYEDNLSPKEKELILAVVNDKCLNYTSLARRLGVTKKTVSSHLLNIYLKLNLPQNNMAGLVWYYFTKGLDNE